MKPFVGFAKVSVTLTLAPGAIVPAETVIYGLPFRVPVLLTMVAFALKALSTTCTGPLIADAVVLVTVNVSLHRPVARLRPRPIAWRS